MSLNPTNEPVNCMNVCNEWITMIKDNGSVELYHIPTIKVIYMKYQYPLHLKNVLI